MIAAKTNMIRRHGLIGVHPHLIGGQIQLTKRAESTQFKMGLGNGMQPTGRSSQIAKLVGKFVQFSPISGVRGGRNLPSRI